MAIINNLVIYLQALGSSYQSPCIANHPPFNSSASTCWIGCGSAAGTSSTAACSTSGANPLPPPAAPCPAACCNCTCACLLLLMLLQRHSRETGAGVRRTRHAPPATRATRHAPQILARHEVLVASRRGAACAWPPRVTGRAGQLMVLRMQALIATALAASITGDEKYKRWHMQVRLQGHVTLRSISRPYSLACKLLLPPFSAPPGQQRRHFPTLFRALFCCRVVTCWAAGRVAGISAP